MNPNEKQDILVFAENPLTTRLAGFILLFLGIIFVAFCWYLPKFFGVTDLTSYLIVLAVLAFVGSLFLLISYFLLSGSIKTLIINSPLNKFTYKEKFLFSTKEFEYNFSDVQRITLEQTSLENTDFYTIYIVIRGGRHLEVPSKTASYQDQQKLLCEELKQIFGI